MPNPDTNSKEVGFFYLLFELVKGLFKLLLSIFERFKDLFINILDLFFNGVYYKYYIFLTLLAIFSLLFYLIYYINPFKIFNAQTSQISLILIASLFLTLFYFTVYRKDSTNHYYAKSSFKTDLSNSKEKYE